MTVAASTLGGRALTEVSESMVVAGQIVSDPDVMPGKPVIKGTRITVEAVLERLAAGESVEQLLQALPRLTREGISAALAFAADAMKAETVYPAKKAG